MKPSLPKGTRDFNPTDMIRRNYILDQIKEVFRLHGYQQIETPAMEQLSTLTGKYGEEGDQLLFKILNSRLHESSKKKELMDDFQRSLDKNTNSEMLTERALRYDLTVPFARYVVMHQHEITFPFKRFQIQPVWRADRPQKGRYREFFQCDADVIGSTSLHNEAELVEMTRNVFQSLGIPVIIKINNRKVLAGMAELTGRPDQIIDLTVALDKLDKIGKDKVIDELLNKGFQKESIELLQPIFDFNGKLPEEAISFLEKWLSNSEIGMKGVAELRELISLTGTEGVELDLTLARGLNYYTGAIFEVKATNVSIGSIAGGGRYDDLTGIFGLPGLSGVGISYGIDRIYDVLEESGRWNEIGTKGNKTLAMFVNFGPDEARYCQKAARELRLNGVATEVYPDPTKMKKQMSYADSNNIPFVILIGSEEMASGLLSLRNMRNGEQHKLHLNQIIQHIKSHLD
ncbi:MAG: histidine--tRNA ligase [Bacteroidota bacterium]